MRKLTVVQQLHKHSILERIATLLDTSTQSQVGTAPQDTLERTYHWIAYARHCSTMLTIEHTTALHCDVRSSVLLFKACLR
jgi:hypothetical protein